MADEVVTFQRLLFTWYYRTYFLRRAYWRFRGWLTECNSIDAMVEQGKIQALESRSGLKQHMVIRELTRREKLIWDEFRRAES